MLAGVGDDDIRREVLCTEDILSRSSFEIVSLIESKEMGRHATENSRTVSAVSSFQRQRKSCSKVEDISLHVLCQSCKKLFYPFNWKGAKNKKLYKYCLSCWCNRSVKVNAIQNQHDDCDLLQQDTQTFFANKSITLNNVIFNKNTLRKAKETANHPRASVKITQLGTCKSVWVSGLADTGTQSNL